ncbi:SCO1664 family protein [Aestuariimicrobium ganziense]|uniref:SCO1664 family protein n=1 Tax=Aestuariimicrobium ganziense TaxID=2773677 RepID=UPI002E2D6E69|nr:SCO1664 family protein [Aestuariimicrobium ganziense]
MDDHWSIAEPPSGELNLVGRLVMASNATFLAEDELGAKWVYKPVRGEAPLWDFPTATLGQREIAAHDLSRAAGWDAVPFTCRVEGPFGPGSAQRWVEESEDDLADLVRLHEGPEGWATIVAGVDGDAHEVVLVTADHPLLRRLALFDVVTNNADRKAGHILHVPATDAHPEAVLGVDHGLTFHAEPKLRTILWGWAGEILTEDEHALLERTLDASEDALGPWLDDDEIQATQERIFTLIGDGCFPVPGDAWPVIPWPPI